MSETLAEDYIDALDGMAKRGPRPLHRNASNASLGGDADYEDGQSLLAYLKAAGPENALRQRLARTLATWDNDSSDPRWAAGTVNNTPERRSVINCALMLDEPTVNLFDELFPHVADKALTVIADDWEEWRTPERRAERDFYWKHYSSYLREKGWEADPLSSLDTATEEVIRRISDPTRAMAYRAKGLVVGYVQSGKTANFTGVIAKAIDAGYRLIIVLTGTTNMLRAQTQRRLDMELVGRENIDREISPDDPAEHEYHDDPDWINGKFVQHGGRPSLDGYPDIARLSDHKGDYKRLKRGFTALEFERREPRRRLYEPVNLYTCNARLVVAKKNTTVLKDLVSDLGRISDRLGEVPVLIVDDESDQASVNTRRPKAGVDAGPKERTSINDLISKLLRMMPRAQYVGYTATPYANLLIDPSDAADIFPANFIIALPRPAGYMGPEDFRDSDDSRPVAERPLTESKERAHVRPLSDEPEESELRAAIDMFILTGAVKLYRERNSDSSFRHHTMLVHEAMGKDSHSATRDLIGRLWKSGGYYGINGLTRLRELYERDVHPVSVAVADDVTPDVFDDLKPYIAEALRLITPPDAGVPVIVVNSDRDLEKNQEALDFDRRRIWRIIVGGNKLARGFTVEGLTVTYYRRATTQVDTLMQMGRWFGFRPGYRDLVRLYTTPDLQELFAGACLDEEYIREELRKYAEPGSEGRQIIPRLVPPIIAQHRGDLKPTGRTKMWNAKIISKAAPGRSMEPVAYPDTREKLRHNAELWLPILDRATTKETFTGVPHGSYDAHIIEAGHREITTLLRNLKWLDDETFRPELNWLESLSPAQLNRWLVYLPDQAGTSSRRTIDGLGPFSVFERTRASSGAFRVISEKRHRNAAFRIVGSIEETTVDPAADAQHADATGAIILYPVVERHMLDGASGDEIDLGKLVMGMCVVTPMSSTPHGGKLIRWVTIDNVNADDIVIDSRDTAS